MGFSFVHFPWNLEFGPWNLSFPIVFLKFRLRLPHETVFGLSTADLHPRQDIATAIDVDVATDRVVRRPSVDTDSAGNDAAFERHFAAGTSDDQAIFAVDAAVAVQVVHLLVAIFVD